MVAVWWWPEALRRRCWGAVKREWLERVLPEANEEGAVRAFGHVIKQQLPTGDDGEDDQKRRPSNRRDKDSGPRLRRRFCQGNA